MNILVVKVSVILYASALVHICISNMKAIYFSVSKYMINAKVGGGRGIKCEACSAFYFFSPTLFNKFNNT